MDLVDVSGIESDWMTGLSRNVLKGEEVVGELRGAGHFAGSLHN